MADSKPIKNSLKIVVLCERGITQWRPGTWPLLEPPAHLLFFLFLFSPFANLALDRTTPSSLKRGSKEGNCTGCFGMGWARDRSSRENGSCWRVTPCAFSLGVRGVVAPRGKRQARVLERKAAIAIQWQREVLHVQASPVCLTGAKGS